MFGRPVSRGRIRVLLTCLRLLSADLWRAMNEDRLQLDRDREALRQADAELKTAEGAARDELHKWREGLLEIIDEGEESLRCRDKSVFRVECEDDVTATLTGTRPIEPEARAAWSEMLSERRRRLYLFLQDLLKADSYMPEIRRSQLLESVDNLGKLNLLGTYEDRIRRSRAKTLAMIQEIEGGCRGVIDLQ